MISLRPATRADLVEFYGKPPTMTVRAYAAVDDENRPKAIGGYYLYAGMAFAFTDQRGLSKRDIVKAGRWFMTKIKNLGIEVIAKAGESDTALRHFGFRPQGDLWRMQ